MPIETPTWLTIFLDLPSASHASGTGFWEAATGYRASPPRGRSGEFATLVPEQGRGHLKLQRADVPSAGVHLDLHVGNVERAASDAVAAGAVLVADRGHRVLRSPAGFAFCLVGAGDTGSAASPGGWPGGHRSRVDQLTIDVAPDRWDDELDFWAALTSWTVTRTGRPQFARLHTPAELPVRILLQRKDAGRTGGHVDIATDDRRAEVERLRAAGATLDHDGPHWTVLRLDDGTRFCVTDRDPDTGLLP